MDTRLAAAAASQASPGARQVIRGLCLLNGIAFFVVAAGLYLRAEWATMLWPWADIGMSLVFQASICAAIAAPSLWIGLTGEFAALAGIGINTIVVNAPATAYLAWRSAEHGEHLSLPIAVSMTALVLGVLVYRWSRGLPAGDATPMPTVVRVAFLAFASVLLAVGLALAMQTEHVFPWSLAPANSTIYGCIFLGAAAYFIHAAVRSTWTHAIAPLWGFLALDLVLFVPNLHLFAAGVEGGLFGDSGGIHMPSLVVVMAVLALSGMLALYMLFASPETRVFRRRPVAA